MRTGPTPPGFSVVRSGGAVGWIREGGEEWLEEHLASGRTLSEWAGAHPEAIVRRGRGAVHAVPAPVRVAPGAGGPADVPGGPERWLVRHYRRGGLVASLLGDRYLRAGRPRPFAEAAAAETARARGVPTPAPLAGVVHPAGPFYRGDLATAFVPGARDLREILTADPPKGRDEAARRGAAPLRERALWEAGRLAGALARAGVEHPDLNSMNVLLEERGGTLRGWVLDLDRARLRPPGRTADGERMVARLLRSLAKESARSGTPLPADAEGRVREGFRTGGREVDDVDDVDDVDRLEEDGWSR